MSDQEDRIRLFNLQKTHGDKLFGERAQVAASRQEVPPDCAGVRVHHLVLEQLDPLFQTSDRLKILTVGDGRGGLEARYLKSFGHHVTASDLCPQCLMVAKDSGLIDDYVQMNAEDLQFPDGSFDFTLAKEMLHHLQRPYLAIYEMLRVARQGVVLVEPHYRFPSTIFAVMRQTIRRWFRREGTDTPVLLPRMNYEESGNYLYRFNPYELTQCALAMGIPAVAFRFCHHYGGCKDGAARGDVAEQWFRRKQRAFAWKDRIKGQQHRALVCFIFFKNGIDAALQRRLRWHGYHIPALKQSPALAAVE